MKKASPFLSDSMVLFSSAALTDSGVVVTFTSAAAAAGVEVNDSCGFMLKQLQLDEES